jgi:hypothetical protein
MALYQSFINFFGKQLKMNLLVCEIFNEKQLNNSQNRGVLNLLFKSGERENICNWRPLTLLNTDNKIIAKMLAERLKTVLPNLIHSDQTVLLKVEISARQTA